ncbi:MAG: mechanosensitive ion channel family protein [Nanoarchaeota archaeon]|nr:mechanosensitive ion channel family protein [Nanoarchaeota archaeon]MBU1631687.1 mechanosensitive ion channel family protein [Nanoarchaeota archaeon]MBU1876251.1 mechanosensitive ion channel family protein [Nanoarchaeota archaeon]
MGIENILAFLKDSAKNIIIVAVVLIITTISQKIIKYLIVRAFRKSSRILKVDETNYKFFQHVVSAIIYLVGIGVAIYVIPSLRTLSVSLFAGAGILAVVIGFASQQALSNVISGMLITIYKPFRVGDRIKIGTDESMLGIVEDINLRHTTIKTFENRRIIVPNSIISTEKIENSNMGDEKIRKYIDFSISYDSNINLAMKIMREETLNHSFLIDNRTEEEKKKNEPIVPVRLIGFADSSVNLRAWVWTKDSASSFILGCDLRKSIKERFDKEGIEIPFPYRTIVYKNDLDKAGKKVKERNKVKELKESIQLGK